MKKGFSLVELLVSLIIISLIISVFAPVISKRLKNSSTALFSSDQITTDCRNSPNYGAECELCTKKYCIKCNIKNCQTQEYINTKKCTCQNCTDFDPDCTECNNLGCTKCQQKQYVKDGKCEPCPSLSYCDGAKIYASCPGNGYYCDDTGIHKCFDKYGSLCTLCTENGCTQCSLGYFLQGGVCKKCMDGCSSCTNETRCNECYSGYYLENNVCKGGCTKIEGCEKCSNAQTCTKCRGDYYLLYNGTCKKCEIKGCQSCSPNAKCTSCLGGYYLYNGNCKPCTDYGTNCSSCDNEGCKSCIQGYHLDNKECKDDDFKFGCSDSNFMQIGSLCVTRKNMGDSSILTIPATVTIAQAGSEHCYASNQKCCWKGKTSNNCDDKYGYSGCTRTVCNFEAANEICSSFNYQGKKWRLATIDEMQNWEKYSAGLGEQGLMLCDHEPGSSLNTKCAVWSVPCYGGSQNGCWIFYIWSSETTDSLHAYTYNMYQGTYGMAEEPTTMAASTRCVSEME